MNNQNGEQRYSAQFSEILELIFEENLGEIEFARDSVTPALMEEASRAYFDLGSWAQKGLLVHLLQDKIHPVTRELMADFLKAPPNFDDDTILMAKIIALCHLDGNFEKFDDYFEMEGEDIERLAANY